MSRFRYRAYDAGGALRSAEIEAASETAALAALGAMGLHPVEITDAAGSPAGEPQAWWQRDILGGPSLSRRDQAMLVRELATLVAAEVTVDEALRIVALQPLSGRVRRAAQGLLGRVTDGAALSEAMAAGGSGFAPAVTGVVQAGEASGSLGPVLLDLSHYLDRGEEIRAKVRSALVYPALLLALAAATLALLATVLVPTLAPIFEEAKAPPPAVIRTLLALKSFVEGNAALVGVGLLALTALVVALRRSPGVRAAIDRMALGLPIAGPLIAAGETARLTRTLGTLLKGGVPLLQAITISGGAVRTAPFRRAAASLETAVRQGRTLSATLAAEEIVPPLAARLAAVGEETGQIDAMLLRAAASFEAGQIARIERMTSLLTPLLTLVIGLAVGGLILSVIDAILGINELVLK